MSQKKSSDEICPEIIVRIENEILPLFEQAVSDDTIIFENPYLIKCWESKECTKEDCPVFEDHLRCWQIAGTFCGDKVQGAFADKYENCKMCEVFKDACPTIVEELGENLNNMLFLLRKEKANHKKHLKKIEYLNKELFSTLENLDTRNREIQELVITDKLTGLYNRHYMMTVLDDEVMRFSRKGYEFSLMMLDVDDFKSFNDNYGHIEGDAVLTTLGQLIKKIIRKYDRAFRYGGEEFVVVLPETNLTIAWMVAERIREYFSKEEFHVSDDQGKPITVSRTVSIGVVTYTEGTGITRLLSQADDAMYTAKSEGKNKVVRFGDK